MKKLTIGEILPLADYERVRPILRPLLMHEKDRRRLPVGSHLTLIFENAQTAWYQVEEMIRTEKMTERAAIQHELDTYNELIPASGELIATLLIEYADASEREAALRRLVGLERHLWLELGAKKIAASFDDRQMSAEKVSAVQFVRFALAGVSGLQLLELAEKGAAAIVVDHPTLAARATLSGIVASSLAEDLS